jgi:hypothetical protein
MRAALGVVGVLSVLANTSCVSSHTLRKVYTEHLGQLTGTRHNPQATIGISGTDLGVSFYVPERGALVFLFGDSWTRDVARWNEDSVAYAPAWFAPSRHNLPRLSWIGNGSEFTGIKIPHGGPLGIEQAIDLGGMNVVMEGVSVDGRIYLFANTGWDSQCEIHRESVLAHTDATRPKFDELKFEHRQASEKFINISAFVESDTVWIFGSGLYRRSDVYLAKAGTEEFQSRGSWRYYNAAADAFVPGEANATPLTNEGCVGELSVRKHPQLGYLMLYNCGAKKPVACPGRAVPGTAGPRGVWLRRASNPWGPWDDPILIFDPEAGADRGYGYFLHRKFSHGNRPYDDGLAEPATHHGRCAPALPDSCCGYGWREECWGGEYGPYLVPSWFTKTHDGGYSIVYTLSSWNPYQVQLMRTVLARPGDRRPQPPPARGRNIPRATIENPDFERGFHGWQTAGDSFRTFRRADGRWGMTTYTVEKREAAVGAVFQDFTVDACTRSLRFGVHGGSGTVRLQRGGEIVRETRGRSGHEPTNQDTPACWELGEYSGETLRLAIVDGAVDPWGFVGTTGFELSVESCTGLVTCGCRGLQGCSDRALRKFRPGIDVFEHR